jgi:phosphate-selective porin OprO/OprP
MRFLLLTVLFLSTLNAGEPTCYTVQLLSRVNSSQNHQEILKTIYDKSCKIMEIGHNITVRCGCFESYKDAKEDKKKFIKKFKHTYITSTYKSRFDTKESISTINLSHPALVPLPSPTVVETIVISEKSIHKKNKQKNKQKKKKNKKKKKSKKKHNKKIKKNKDESRVHYIKKRDVKWFYTKYLQKLKSRKPSRFYGYEYSFGAQLSYDSAYFSEQDDNYYANAWRRVRVNYDGSFLKKKLFFEFEYSFTGSSNYKDVYIGYANKFKNIDTKYRVKAGNIKIPFSLDGYSSSKNITFMERGLNDAFAENRKLGSELLLYKKMNNSRVNLLSAVYTNSIDERLDDEIVKNGYSLRATYAYKFQKNHLLSVGFGFQERDMNGDDLKIKQGAEASLIDKKYVSVKIKDVKNLTKFNLEALYIYNKYSLQAEYTDSMIAAYNGEVDLQNYNFYAYYLQGSYFLVGSGKRYKFKTATLGKIKPNRDGALELAARYSYINLNDTTPMKTEVGGTQGDYTFGLNWYINNEMKIMFNYIVAKPNVYKDDLDDSYVGLYQLIEGRVLFSF